MEIGSRWVLSVILALSVGSPLAESHEAPSGPQAQAQDPVDRMIGRYNLDPAFEKLGRGLSNTVWGWLELPLAIDRRYSETNTAGSVFTGTVIGLIKGLARTGVGLYETATFWFPYPEHFAPILPTLEYFQKPRTSRRRLPLE